MTNSLSKAGKSLFAHDPDVRPYIAADTAYDDDEYVPNHTDDERAEADRRRKVSLIFYFFFLPTPTVPPASLPLSHPFIPNLSYTYTA